MVYSTCSLTVAQNEGVVSWLLAQEPRAKLLPVTLSQPCYASTPAAVGGSAASAASAASGATTTTHAAASSDLVVDACPFTPGRVEHTVRFNPLVSKTSGLFIAKFTKTSKTDGSTG